MRATGATAMSAIAQLDPKPPRALKDVYGIGEKEFPEGFGGQMLYPFRR